MSNVNEGLGCCNEEMLTFACEGMSEMEVFQLSYDMSGGEPHVVTQEGYEESVAWSKACRKATFAEWQEVRNHTAANERWLMGAKYTRMLSLDELLGGV